MKEHITRHAKKLIVALVGVLVVLIGIVMIPYPGPGWLVVFAGLAVLATEFEFAQGVLDNLHDKYERWQDWVKCQNLFIQLCILAFTGVVVIVTIWLINGYGVINKIFNLNLDWLMSPFFR